MTAKVKKRVDEAITALGYIPHRAGRTLASRRSLIVGTIVPTIENAIFARHVMAFQQRLNEAGYTLLLATSEYDPDQEFKQARVFLEHGVDALMLVGQRRSAAFYQMLAQAGIPFINTWRNDPTSPYPSCGFDHERALTIIVDHLVRLGHQRFGVVTGYAGVNDRVEARLIGIRKALAAHGLELDERLVASCEYTIEAGRHGLDMLLARDPAITAVVGGNDVLAAGVLREARDRGIRIPDELSIVGFGDLELAANT